MWRPRKTSRKSLGVFTRKRVVKVFLGHSVHFEILLRFFAKILIYTFTKYFPEYTSVSCIFVVFCNWEDRSTQRKLRI